MLRVMFAPHADAMPLKIRFPDEFRTKFSDNEVFNLKFHVGLPSIGRREMTNALPHFL